MLLQVIAPGFVLRSFYGKDVVDEYALFLARSGGLPISTIGALLIWASFDEAIRLPVIIAALISKALFLTIVAISWRVTGKGYALTIAVDAIVVCLLGLYLLGY